MIVKIDDSLHLEQTELSHAEELLEVVKSNRLHLSEFLGWVNKMETVADFEKYILFCEAENEAGKEISFTIFYQNKIVGRIGISQISAANNSGNLGYWLAKDTQKKGIIHRASKAVLDIGFKDLELNRIEIKAATRNLKSQAIAIKHRFTKEGILRQAEQINEIYNDMVLFSMLKENWD